MNTIYDRVFHKIEKSRGRRDKSSDEIDFEKHKVECTFKPHINNHSRSVSKNRKDTSATPTRQSLSKKIN